MSIASFADTHKPTLATFQNAEEAFVWGRNKVSDELWYLEDDEAVNQRAFVNEKIVCPVPGCGARLTTAHRTKKRDGLQHFATAGGHSRESVFHSQGCALIESWLNATYPNSHAQREEYTNEQGERRADVLLTGPTGHRVAFEIQYSPITPDAWRRRHESYRQQGIVDVWLFGHSGKQLKLDAEDRLKPNPTHDEVVASGSALMFINPTERLIGVAVGTDQRFDAAIDAYREERFSVLDKPQFAELKLRPLEDFRPSPRTGLGGEWLDWMYEKTHALRAHNHSALIEAAAIRERRKREAEAKRRAWETRRTFQQQKIRDVLSVRARWSQSDALALITGYFGEYLDQRIEWIDNPTAPPGLLVKWQCVIYFDLIAGRTTPFGTRDAFKAITARNVNMGQPDAFKLIARYLYRLRDEGYLRVLPGLSRYPSFVATPTGAWW